jgi:tetraacyldisaccharide-1-P 4'-kinase
LHGDNRTDRSTKPTYRGTEMPKIMGNLTTRKDAIKSMRLEMNWSNTKILKNQMKQKTNMIFLHKSIKKKKKLRRR